MKNCQSHKCLQHMQFHGVFFVIKEYSGAILELYYVCIKCGGKFDGCVFHFGYVFVYFSFTFDMSLVVPFKVTLCTEKFLSLEAIHVVKVLTILAFRFINLCLILFSLLLSHLNFIILYFLDL